MKTSTRQLRDSEAAVPLANRATRLTIALRKHFAHHAIDSEGACKLMLDAWN